MSKHTTRRITCVNNRIKARHGMGSILPNVSPSRGDITVSVRYSGKVISQRLTPQDIKSAYRSAVENVSHGKKIQ